MNPVEMRESIESFLIRALFGPVFGSSNTWLGSTGNKGVVVDGFSCTDARPVGPWVNEKDEEVLSTPPYLVYGVGILFPHVTAQVQAQIDAALQGATEDGLNESEAQDDQPINVLDDDQVDANLDDNVQPVESTTRPRAIALSIRVPKLTAHLDVAISGGTYEQVSVLGQGQPWWSRVAHGASDTVSLDQSREMPLHLGAVNVTVGTTIREYDGDTNIVTVWVRNDTSAINELEFSEKSLFQTQIKLTVKKIVPYELAKKSKKASLDLLYRNHPRWASGHGTDASATKVNGVWCVQSNAVPIAKVKGLTPDVPYAIGMLDLAEFNQQAVDSVDRLIQDYGIWIQELQLKSTELPVEYREIGLTHVNDCQRFLDRIRAGWLLVNSNSDVRIAIRDMSLAMNMQRVAYSAPLRDVVINSKGECTVSGANPHSLSTKGQSKWRAFQIAFILASLPSVVSRQSEVTEPIDVIWMPTGGGKTEAYLGLAGFVILWERLTGQDNDIENRKRAFTKVFMRYTLRLLTSQQLTRASSLICALEVIRRKKVDLYGTTVIRIGAWLGGKTSPNRHVDAISLYGNLVAGRANGKSFMQTRCPWCGTQIGQVDGGAVVGYHKVDHPNPAIRSKRVMSACPAMDCDFKLVVNNGNKNTTYTGIPVLEVDDDLYLSPPDFVVGTIDKVARLSWVPEAQAMFGLRNGARRSPAPSLFIQDELHLIAGPLGSIDGAFEALLEHLCVTDGGATPMIVASTATTKNFEDQLEKLYARKGSLIPPPGLEITDSFFSIQDEKDSGKHYVAICPTGYGTSLAAQTRVLGLLAHASGVLNNSGENSDPWWTNVVFFSSRRALGQLHSQIETGFKTVMDRLRLISGVPSGPLSQDKSRFTNTRFVRNLRQLTSTSNDNLNQVLDELSLGLDSTSDRPIDICFATSMIEVGLDVPRLGLMTVIGQPKSASQYIQVSGRVGRGENSPGLIVTCLAPHNVRDRSHYETFTDWHQRLYASVENSSVTPFTSRSLERSAPNVLAAALRIFGDPENVQNSVRTYWSKAVEILANRASEQGEDAVAALNGQIQNLERHITSEFASSCVWDKYVGKNPYFMFTADESIEVDRVAMPLWRALNSMRSVEGDAGLLMMQAEGKSIPKSGKSKSDAEPPREYEL